MTAAPAAGPGLQTLPAGPTVLLKRLDALLEGWGTAVGAAPMIMPPLLPVADLSRLDVYDNFPHQALVVTTLDLTRHQQGVPYEEFAPGALEPALLGLPSAACFAVYLHHEGRALPDGTTVTVLGRCFRREDHYDGLRRLLGFHMREIVALGSYEFTQEHLRRFEERVTALADALGLALRKEAATDPFYDRGGQRALLQRLAPVKHEFLVDGLAIASLNVHRNFFGERCGITLDATGQAVHTSCAAFGLERWLSVLHTRYGSWEAATRAVEKAAAALGGADRTGGAER
ncbi:hypothetical protein A8W25_25145 [Streptomyces sp. ERV7]|uniref:hypothetical protein n=1 Tax=Streptomyces sp. ERV7 TaxID=1322334 RepID=UPI0007F358A6|nr:hypothetical protein [Streptomyces sp. ERV7]OAR22855.1 hypothetical protein A8W25_25145 [Streptomyces sp. ERV7]